MKGFITVNNVTDGVDSKRVTLTATGLLPTDNQVQRMLMENRARARALVAAGFAENGFLRDFNPQLSSPKLKRRTEVLSRDQVGQDAFRYEIEVESGPLLE